MKIIYVIFAALILLSQPSICMAIEQQSDQESDLTQDLFEMTQSVNELIQLLKAQQSTVDEFQRLQTAISYLSFRSRSIEMKQYELRFKKERRDRFESTIARIEADPDKFDKSFQTKNPVTTSNDPKPSESVKHTASFVGIRRPLRRSFSVSRTNSTCPSSSTAQENHRLKYSTPKAVHPVTCTFNAQKRQNRRGKSIDKIS